jgi:hypothetical protein
MANAVYYGLDIIKELDRVEYKEVEAEKQQIADRSATVICRKLPNTSGGLGD